MNSETSLKYHVSAFGDFSKVEPSEDIIKECLGRFFSHGLLPGGMQEFNPVQNRLDNRLSLQSMKNGLSVNFLTNRVDFILHPLPGTPASALSPAEYIDLCGSLYLEIADMFGVTINRTGLTIDHVLAIDDDSQLESLRGKIMNPAYDVVDDEGAFSAEWSVKNVIQKPCSLFPGKDMNITYKVSKITAQFDDGNGQREFEAPLLNVDINFPAINTVPRIPAEKVVEFWYQALEFERSVRTKLDALRG